ncbi:MAG TPA: phosphotransferase family protein [Sporichthyaceae bacterium]|nr:phosphotransferase family protein [Sporichthyaceae bacterium]
MTAPPVELSLEQVTEGIGELFGAWHPDARSVSVSDAVQVFGGNARRAWAASVEWVDACGVPSAEPVILLVRQPGSQVRTDPAEEVRHLSALAQQGVRAPRVWAHDLDGHLLGGPAVLLQRMTGSADPVSYLAADPATGRARTLDLARAAAELHSATPAHTEVPGAQSHLAHWRDQFLAARLEPHPALGWLFDWLADHERPPERFAVVHGDFRVGNVLYDGERITGVLDWEMAHVGNPTEDLAWAYRALWSPARFLPLPEFVEAYVAAGGGAVDADSLLWHRVFAEVKFAVISLQAARSVVDGLTMNLRLADRTRTVVPAVDLCLSWIDQSKVADPC